MLYEGMRVVKIECAVQESIIPPPPHYDTWTYLDCLLIVFFTASLPLLWIPLSIYVSNLPVFMIDESDLSFWLGGGTLVGSLIGSVALFILPASVRAWGIRVIFAMGVLVWIQANLFAWHVGIIDGAGLNCPLNDIRPVIDTTVWVLVFPLLVLARNWCRKFARTVAMLTISIELAATLIGLHGIQPTKETPFTIDENMNFNYSADKNVIILVLDTFDTIIFSEIIKASPSMENRFDGFTYYPNIVGGFAYTSLSVPLILTGQYYDDLGPFSEYVNTAFHGDSLPNVLKQHGFRTEFYTGWDGFTHASVCADPLIWDNITPGKISTEKTVADLQLLYKSAILRALPYLYKGPAYDCFSWTQIRDRDDNVLPIFKESPDNHFQSVLQLFKNQWNVTNTAQNHSLDRDDFVKDLTAKASATQTLPTFKYYHLVGLHPPLVLGNMCVKNTDDSARQVAQILMDNLVQPFLEHLKKLNIYDNSMIFIIGDHGRTPDVHLPEAYLEAGCRGRFVQRNALMGRALPLFLFKPFQSHGPLKTSMAPGTQADIAPTVYEALNLSGKTDGISLFQLQDNTQRERRFLSTPGVHIGDPIPKRTEYRINGFSWLDSSWHETGYVYAEGKRTSVNTQKYSPGTVLHFGNDGNVLPYLSAGWNLEDDNPEGTPIQGSCAKIRLPIEVQSENCKLIFQLICPPGAKDHSPCPIHVFVNEKELAAWNITRSGDYTIMIPRELIVNQELNCCFRHQTAQEKPSTRTTAENILFHTLRVEVN